MRPGKESLGILYVGLFSEANMLGIELLDEASCSFECS